MNVPFTQYCNQFVVIISYYTYWILIPQHIKNKASEVGNYIGIIDTNILQVESNFTTEFDTVLF